MTTETIYQAFVKAQKAFGPALKTSTNPHFRSRYADLSACVEAVIDALNDNGIALMQTSHPCDNGVNVETILAHESGQTISSGVLHVPASKQDAQGYGSALTYARRYSLMAICGIAPEDDDGNRAAQPVKKIEPKANETLVVSQKTGEVIGIAKKPLAEDDDLPEWSTAAKIVEEVKARKTRAKTTYYNLESCPGEQVKAAESYLVAAGAKRITEIHWKSSIKLDKLTQFIDETFSE